MLGFLTLILTQPRAYRAVGRLDGDLVRVRVRVRFRVTVGLGLGLRLGLELGLGLGLLDGDQASAVEGGVERGQAERACRAHAQLEEVALHRLVGARVWAPLWVTGTY